MSFTTPNPVEHDYSIPYGQSFPIIVQFSDDMDLPKDMTGYSAQILVKKNNSDTLNMEASKWLTR